MPRRPSGNVASPASKITLLGNVTGNAANPSCEDWPLTADCLPSDYDSHTVGNLKFGPDGMLYVAVGDGASYASVDVRALRAQSLDRLSGQDPAREPGKRPGPCGQPLLDRHGDGHTVEGLGVRRA